MTSADPVPRVFCSYSHDNDFHKQWVLVLCERLVRNGVEVLLDQWDLRLGSDLPTFMEHGLTGSDRVLAICTSAYVTKANAGLGGVGYEKMILTAQLMQNISSTRIFPVVKDNTLSQPMPTFLSSRVYVDFRNEVEYETKYAQLLREIHGVPIQPRPPLGPNPFREAAPAPIAPRLETRAERYMNPSLKGSVTFDPTNNDGRFVIGAGDMAFETCWGGASNESVWVYHDPPSIRTVSLATDVHAIGEIADASRYDTSSRTRRARLGDVVIWQNSAGYYAATRLENLAARSARSATDSLTFTYAIQPTRSPSFLNL